MTNASSDSPSFSHNKPHPWAYAFSSQGWITFQAMRKSLDGLDVGRPVGKYIGFDMESNLAQYSLGSRCGASIGSQRWHAL